MPIDIERPKFVVDLLNEIDAFDAELFKPPYPISAETEDKVVGELGHWQRKLYSLMRYYHRQMKLLAVEQEYDTSCAKCDSACAICEAKYKYELLTQILWGTIRSELSLWNAPSIGVRVNWQVVTSKPEDDDMEGFKKFILGRFGK